MKETGIVRRIDELGRIVIPKEIRRSYRIKEGDTLEIFTEEDRLVLKKTSELLTLKEICEKVAKPLSEFTKKTVLVTDTDEIIFAKGESSKTLVGKKISDKIAKVISSRRSLTKQCGKQTITEEGDEDSLIAFPIILRGDGVGTVIVLVGDLDSKREEIIGMSLMAVSVLENTLQ